MKPLSISATDRHKKILPYVAPFLTVYRYWQTAAMGKVPDTGFRSLSPPMWINRSELQKNWFFDILEYLEYIILCFCYVWSSSVSLRITSFVLLLLILSQITLESVSVLLKLVKISYYSGFSPVENARVFPLGDSEPAPVRRRASGPIIAVLATTAAVDGGCCNFRWKRISCVSNLDEPRAGSRQRAR
jgi:hypothetical protein